MLGRWLVVRRLAERVCLQSHKSGAARQRASQTNTQFGSDLLAHPCCTRSRSARCACRFDDACAPCLSTGCFSNWSAEKRTLLTRRSSCPAPCGGSVGRTSDSAALLNGLPDVPGFVHRGAGTAWRIWCLVACGRQCRANRYARKAPRHRNAPPAFATLLRCCGAQHALSAGCCRSRVAMFTCPVRSNALVL